MIRNYKALGLAFVAMLALSAFVAQGASAVPLTVEGLGGGTNTFLTGDQDGGTHVLKSTAEVKCTEAHFLAKATTGATINELTVTPSYPTEKAGGGNNCTAFGFANTHINMNGCTFTFTTPTSIGIGVVTWGTSQIHLVCPEVGGVKQKVAITPTSFGVSVCTQNLAEQTPTVVKDAEGKEIPNHVIGRNVTGSSPMDITLEITVKGIHYTGTGGVCGTAGTNAELNGNSTVKCYKAEPLNAANQVGCTFS